MNDWSEVTTRSSNRIRQRDELLALGQYKEALKLQREQTRDEVHLLNWLIKKLYPKR
jgi:hypothetical protein